MKILKHIYKPLPKSLTIKESGIHGLGLFAKEDIPEGTMLGVSHVHSSFLPYEEVNMEFSFEENKVKVFYEGNHMEAKEPQYNLHKDNIFPNSLIRTPLGGFINHSDNENLNFIYLNGGLWGVVTLVDIKINEELTLNYNLTPCGVITE